MSNFENPFFYLAVLVGLLILALAAIFLWTIKKTSDKY
jgi:hypothetical protein